VSIGRIPTGVKSGVAIEYLQEADATIIRPKQRQFQYAFTEVGRLMLAYMKRYYIEPRKVKVRGEGGEMELVEFSREDIPDDADVRVNVGTALTYTRTARLQELKELYALKAIGRETLLKNYEFPNVAEAIEEAEREELRQKALEMAPQKGKAPQEEMNGEEEAVKEADAENLSLAQGGEAQIEPEQNHEIHIQVHQLFQRSREYQNVLPENRDKLEAHIQEHIRYLNQEAKIPMVEGGETYGAS
jgi:hypothetical protein